MEKQDKNLKLKKQPFPGRLGKKIFDNISIELWNKWLDYELKFINENCLNLLDPKNREILGNHMSKFLNLNDYL